MTSDQIALVIIVPLCIAWFLFIIIKPGVILTLQRKLYKKVFDIDMKFSSKTEGIIRCIGALVLGLTFFAFYKQFRG